MILSWFRRRPSEIPAKLLEEVVSAARAPTLYVDIGVPDTVDARFELLVLHVQLALRRMRAEASLAELSQEFVDAVFADLDRQVREAGVGHDKVPKKMRGLAGTFYARMAAYDPGLDAKDRDALAGALEKGVFGGDGAPGLPAERLAAYLLAAEAHLSSSVDAAAILAGRLAFVPSR